MKGIVDISLYDVIMRMQNLLDTSFRQKANFVFWCPETFPDNIAITWDFLPVQETGLCILFFPAIGQNCKDIFDKSLEKRTGDYKQYRLRDINTYHDSYFRRNVDASDFQLCNLRKSYCNIIATQKPILYLA